jgi:S-DNA-T family DNA segregation ATPase FtsK/SpoIIIE
VKDCQGEVSISLLQRKFRIGFNRAARVMEQLKRDGAITPKDGGKGRQTGN